MRIFPISEKKLNLFQWIKTALSKLENYITETSF